MPGTGERQPGALPPAESHITHILNSSGGAAPARTLLEISEGLDPGKKRWIGILCANPASTQIAVVLAEIADAAPGPCQVDGQALIDVDVLAGETLAVGDFISMKSGSRYAQKSDDGSARVEEVFGAGVGPAVITCYATLAASSGSAASGEPYLYITTSDVVAGEVQAKKVDDDGLPTGDAETFLVIP